MREGSGIESPQDLKGKKIGVPFVSTTHFHMLFALEQFGIEPTEVELLNLQPNAIAAAWERGDIDAAFIWDPALSRIKKNGKVLITSGDLSNWGKATFDGKVVSKEFAESNKDFMCKFIQTIAAIDEAYRSNPGAFSGDSDNAKKITGLIGGDPANVPVVLALYVFYVRNGVIVALRSRDRKAMLLVIGLLSGFAFHVLYNFPTLEQQASATWLGGGAAAALQATSEFLKTEKKVDSLLPDYNAVVTDEYVKAAMNGC